MATRTMKGGYSVSGPGVDRDGIPSTTAAVSFAQWQAEHADGEATFYVRNGEAEPYARVERSGGGTVYTYPQK
jgi:hypothetical protein